MKPINFFFPLIFLSLFIFSTSTPLPPPPSPPPPISDSLYNFLLILSYTCWFCTSVIFPLCFDDPPQFYTKIFSLFITPFLLYESIRFFTASLSYPLHLYDVSCWIYTAILSIIVAACLVYHFWDPIHDFLHRMFEVVKFIWDILKELFESILESIRSCLKLGRALFLGYHEEEDNGGEHTKDGEDRTE